MSTKQVLTLALPGSLSGLALAHGDHHGALEQHGPLHGLAHLFNVIAPLLPWAALLLGVVAALIVGFIALRRYLRRPAMPARDEVQA